MIRFLVAAALVSGAVSAQKLTPVTDAAYPKIVAAHKGKVVLVDFWATWCKPCRAEMPVLAKLSERLAAKGFDLVTISADEPEQEAAAVKFLKEGGVTTPGYLKKTADDDKFNAMVDPSWQGAMPALFLYDRSGKRVRSFIGETPVKDVEAAVEKLLR